MFRVFFTNDPSQAASFVKCIGEVTSAYFNFLSNPDNRGKKLSIILIEKNAQDSLDENNTMSNDNLFVGL